MRRAPTPLEVASAHSDTAMIKQIDGSVIGGGNIGAIIEFYLAKAGVSTSKFNKGSFGAEQSHKNRGWLRQMSHDGCELPLVIASMRDGLN